MRFRIIGPGRAGGAFATALTSVGWELDATFGRGDEVTDAAADVSLVLICVPDRSVGAVADALRPGSAAVVHIAGSQGLAVLGDHERTGSIHPLMTMPDAERGAARLLDRCHFAVAGDPITTTIADALGGVAFSVADEQRMLYHAAAAIASNHLVALTAQVERLADLAGVPTEAYWPLMTASLANVVATDPATALTGPAARADWETIRGHLDAIASAGVRSGAGLGTDSAANADSTLYLALAAEAARLAGHELPEDLS